MAFFFQDTKGNGQLASSNTEFFLLALHRDNESDAPLVCYSVTCDISQSIKSHALGYTVNDHVYVIYPAVSYFFGRFHWSRAKTGYSVTDIRPCTDV